MSALLWNVAGNCAGPALKTMLRVPDGKSPLRRGMGLRLQGIWSEGQAFMPVTPSYAV